MKKLKTTAIIICTLILILEMLPWGAVLNFATDPAESVDYIRKTYSYFSLTPFGYANFSPLLCAILSVVLMIYHIICSTAINPKNYAAGMVMNIIAIVLSLTPLLYGIIYFSATAICITLSLAVLFVITCIMHNKMGK